VLHLRHYLQRHLRTGLAREIRKLAAVVKQRLISPGLVAGVLRAMRVDVDLRERALAE